MKLDAIEITSLLGKKGRYITKDFFSQTSEIDWASVQMKLQKIYFYTFYYMDSLYTSRYEFQEVFVSQQFLR